MFSKYITRANVSTCVREEVWGNPRTRSTSRALSLFSFPSILWLKYSPLLCGTDMNSECHWGSGDWCGISNLQQSAEGMVLCKTAPGVVSAGAGVRRIPVCVSMPIPGSQGLLSFSRILHILKTHHPHWLSLGWVFLNNAHQKSNGNPKGVLGLLWTWVGVAKYRFI